MAPSLPAYDRHEVWRYGLGGAAALVLVVLGITALDRLAFSPEPIGSAAVASSRSAASPDQAAPSTAVRVAAAPAAVTEPRHGRTIAPPAEPDTRIGRLTAQAAAGDASAQLELGLSYVAGADVARDERSAIEWLEKAAAQGLAPAQFNLAVLYERGRGVERDLQQAFRWYGRAADQGYASAQHNLATLYVTGTGVAQNYQEAARWFGRAAETRNPQSLYSLGLMHEHGLGLARDMTQARGYYQRAAAGGSADAVAKLAALGPPTGAEPQPTETAEASQTVANVEPSAGPANAEPDQPLDRRQTAELQRLLARLDFAPGSADGVAGRRTVAAIKLYQEFAGLPVDGRPTRALLEDLRQVALTLGRQPRSAR